MNQADSFAQQQTGFVHQYHPEEVQVSDYGAYEEGVDYGNGTSQADSSSVHESMSNSSLSTSYQQDSDNEAGISSSAGNQLQQSGAFAYDPNPNGGLANYFDKLQVNSGTSDLNAYNYNPGYVNGNGMAAGPVASSAPYPDTSGVSYAQGIMYQSSGVVGLDQSRNSPPRSSNSYGVDVFSSSNPSIMSERERSEYDLQSETMPLPLPDSIERLTAHPMHEPHTNKQRTHCDPDLMRCTVRSMPCSRELLHKTRLPLGVVLQPFKDVYQLPVLHVSSIVRCRACRSYINPYVAFLDNRRWRCNLCMRTNELPEDFLYDPSTRTYGDVFARAELRAATLEYVAPTEYAVRPPQPALFVFVLDVSPSALAVDYFDTFCSMLRECLDRLPGDARKQLAFITFDSAVHFYALRTDARVSPDTDDQSIDSRRLFSMHVCADLEELALPLPADALLVNLAENRKIVRAFLASLPSFWHAAHPKSLGTSGDQRNALGSALTLAHRLIAHSGGRITVVNCSLPNVGVGSLQPREQDFRKSPNFTADTPSTLLAPAVDMYKRLGVECSTAQVGIDFFVLGTVEYVDLASLAPAARYSAGAVFYYPLAAKPPVSVGCFMRKFEGDLKRYFTRKLGFEAVLRVRCTRGISIQNFFGNFFVRATDLCNLANVSPDLGCAAQLRINESLSEYVNATIQCAVLYTHATGERRIRVHTLSLPISQNATEVMQSVDQQAVIALLARMAAERAVSRSLAEARDGLVTSLVDILNALRTQHVTHYATARTLTVPHALRLLGIYILALLKSTALKPTCHSIDDRVFALEQLRQLPARFLLLKIYPACYRLDVCEDSGFLTKEVDLNNLSLTTSSNLSNSNSMSIDAPTYPPLVRLSSRNIVSSIIYLIDNGDALYIYVGDRVRSSLLKQLFGVDSITTQQCSNMTDLPALNNLASNYVRRFVQHLRSRRAFGVVFAVVKEEPPRRSFLSNFLLEDRNEVVAAQANQSYVDFLSDVREQIK